MTRTLFEQIPRLEQPALTGCIRRDFQRFHAKNPHVFDALVNISRQMKDAGCATWSMKAAFEALRFTQMTTYGEDWKLNNNYTAHYSRLVMERCPDLDGFFRTREAA